MCTELCENLAKGFVTYRESIRMLCVWLCRPPHKGIAMCTWKASVAYCGRKERRAVCLLRTSPLIIGDGGWEYNFAKRD